MSTPWQPPFQGVTNGVEAPPLGATCVNQCGRGWGQHEVLKPEKFPFRCLVGAFICFHIPLLYVPSLPPDDDDDDDDDQWLQTVSTPVLGITNEFGGFK